MPTIDTHLDSLGGARYISVADIQSALHQLPVAEDDSETAENLSPATTIANGTCACVKALPVRGN